MFLLGSRRKVMTGKNDGLVSVSWAQPPDRWDEEDGTGKPGELWFSTAAGTSAFIAWCRTYQAADQMLLPKVARKTSPALCKLRHHWVLLGRDWCGGMVAGGPMKRSVPNPWRDPQWFCIWLAASAATVTTICQDSTKWQQGTRDCESPGAGSRQESEQGFRVHPTYKHLLHWSAPGHWSSISAAVGMQVTPASDVPLGREAEELSKSTSQQACY